MREDVVGRANVEDTPELQAYYKDLARFEAAALWTVANDIEPWEPQSRSVPVLWRYQDLRDHVLRSVSLVSPEKAGRRVIYLNNPGRRDAAAAVGARRQPRLPEADPRDMLEDGPRPRVGQYRQAVGDRILPCPLGELVDQPLDREDVEGGAEPAQ